MPLPGGCAIGKRLLDQHIKPFACLGATVSERSGFLEGAARKGIAAASVTFDFPTVTDTMNVMLATSLLPGETTIRNASMEPEVADLADCLRQMGASVCGIGTDKVMIHGRRRLSPFLFRVMKDMIVTGTFLIAGAMAGSPLVVRGRDATQQERLIEYLRQAGAEIKCHHTAISMYKAPRLRAVNIETGPYPCFPTDLQPPFMALLSIAHGTSTVTENIFKSRFSHVESLVSMGANITVQDNKATVYGASGLLGGEVTATDLRCGASLLLAGFIAKGTTIIQKASHLYRGYSNVDIEVLALASKSEGLGRECAPGSL